MAHKWSKHDDLTAYYVFGPGRIASSEKEIAQRLGIAPAGFHMRVGNVKAPLGPGGRRNYAKQSADVFKAHHDTAEPELRALVLEGFAGQRRS